MASFPSAACKRSGHSIARAKGCTEQELTVKNTQKNGAEGLTSAGPTEIGNAKKSPGSLLSNHFHKMPWISLKGLVATLSLGTSFERSGGKQAQNQLLRALCKSDEQSRPETSISSRSRQGKDRWETERGCLRAPSHPCLSHDRLTEVHRIGAHHSKTIL